MSKKRNKQIERRIEVAYGKSCSGIQIDILDIPKVFAVGERLIESGADDDELAKRLRDFVDLIRFN